MRGFGLRDFAFSFRKINQPYRALAIKYGAMLASDAMNSRPKRDGLNPIESI